MCVCVRVCVDVWVCGWVYTRVGGWVCSWVCGCAYTRVCVQRRGSFPFMWSNAGILYMIQSILFTEADLITFTVLTLIPVFTSAQCTYVYDSLHNN